MGLASLRFTNDDLANALRELPQRSLIVIEDVDALFVKRDNVSSSQLTFSGMLNALDGLVSTEGVITIMTTNHLEKLDKALIRGGRVDRRFLFELPRKEQYCDLFRMHYPEASDNLVQKFATTVFKRREQEAKTICTLQQLFIKMRKQDAETCANGVDEFIDNFLPEDPDVSDEYRAIYS